MKQALSRKLKKYDKDLTKYNSEWQFQQQFKMFACLALLPPADVMKIHDLMMSDGEECAITYTELKTFDAEYFKPTWLNGIYKVEEWNCNERYACLASFHLTLFENQ